MRVASSILVCLLLGFVLVACGDSDPVATIPERADGTLTIMTYNVEDMDMGGKKAGDLGVYSGIAGLLKTEQVDVVCIEEIQPGSNRNQEYLDGSVGSWGDVSCFNSALAKQNYYMPYYGFNNAGSVRLDYIAFWSRYPVDNVTSIKDLVGTIDPSTGIRYKASRPILGFKVRYKGHDIWFYGAHLKSNAGGVTEQNAGQRRAQAFHLARYIIRNHNPETDYIVILGDMNTMEADYDNSGNSCIDYLCLKFDNPFNMANDFVPVNLKHLGSVTNYSGPVYGGQPGSTHPGDTSGYPDATFDHIIISPALYRDRYIQGSVQIVQSADGVNNGYADHFPVKLKLQF